MRWDAVTCVFEVLEKIVPDKISFTEKLKHIARVPFVVENEKKDIGLANFTNSEK